MRSYADHFDRAASTQTSRSTRRKSTGPRTEEGKAVVRLNAVKHGTLTETTVLPFLESGGQWEEHRRGILGSIGPAGHVESYSGRHLSIRFDLRNCNAMCAGCNRRHNSDPAPYRAFMLACHGPDVVEELGRLRGGLGKVSDDELSRLPGEYKAR